MLENNKHKISKKDLYFFNLSLKISQYSKCIAKHSCIITFKNKPLSYAVNKDKINSINLKKHIFYKLTFDKNAEKRKSRQETLHAEVAAILKLKCNVSNLTLYSARTLKNGEPGNSTPCEACMQVIEALNIKYIVFWGKYGIEKVKTKDFLRDIHV